MEAKEPIGSRIYWMGGIAALGGFLFGFDLAVVSGVLPFIQKQFGLSPGETGWFVSSALVGCIAGVALSGALTDKSGRKPLMVLAAVLFSVSAIGCALLPDYHWVIFARILGGVGVGLASNIVPLYISEIAPSSIRGRMVTAYQLAVTGGILVAYASNALIAGLDAGTDIYAYLFTTQPWRGMFLVGALPALVFLAGILKVPESPRWLLQHRKTDQALRLMDHLYGIRERDAIHLSFQRNQSEKATVKSFRSLFAKGQQKMLWLGLLLPLFSQFSGINAIIYYGPIILEDSGVSLENAFTGQLFFGIANLLFTLIAIWKVDKLGRRPLYLIGTAGATFSLFVTGLLIANPGAHNTLLMLAVLSFLACFACSIGPLKFVVASEIFPSRIRGRAMAMSIMVMWIADAVIGQLTPLALEQLGTRYTFWAFAGCCLIALIVVFRLLPETKGKSLESIERDLQ